MRTNFQIVNEAELVQGHIRVKVDVERFIPQEGYIAVSGDSKTRMPANSYVLDFQPIHRPCWRRPTLSERNGNMESDKTYAVPCETIRLVV